MPDIDLLFGGICTFVIMRLYGVTAAIIAAAIISIPTYFFWQHPYAIVVYMLEAFAVGFFYKKINKSQVFIVTTFWVLVGIPLICALYFYFVQVDFLASVHIGLKDAVNSIFNALIANVIINWAPFPWGKMKLLQRSAIPLNQVLFESIVICIALPTLCISLMYSHAQYTDKMDTIKEGMNQETIRISHVIKIWEEEHLLEITDISMSITSQDLAYPSDIQERLSHVRDRSPYLHNLYVADASGTAIAFSPAINEQGESTIGINFSDRPYFDEVKKTQKNIVSSVFRGRGGTLKPIITLNAPVFENNRFIGYVSGSLNLDYLLNRLKESSEASIMYTLIDQDGKVVVSTNPKLSPLDDFAQKSLARQMGKQESIFYQNIDGKDLPTMPKWDKSYYIYQQKVGDEIPWTLVAERPLKPLRDYMQNIYSRSFIIVIICTYMAFLIASLLSRLITKPIYELAKITTYLPEQVSSQMSIHWPTSKIQEIDSLVRNYTHTADVLKDNFLKIQYMAQRDPLTGLPNRRGLNDFFQNAKEETKANDTKISIISFDVDRFKFINDSLGHAAGDELLQGVAKRLVCLLGTGDIAIRLGGDEFILISSGRDVNELSEKADLVIKGFNEPFMLYNRPIFLSASIGLAVYPDDGLEVEPLLKKADIALYRAKELGKNGYQIYSPSLGETNEENHLIETALRSALEEDQFTLVYQPQFELDSNKFVGVEALIRWSHPTLGMIPPDKFIPMAEKMGLIAQIGEWVLRTACAEVNSWGLPGFRIAVNVSSCQFENTEFLTIVRDVMQANEFIPDQLELEITESVAIKNITHTVAMLDELFELGVKVALDDFGTGFSSLGYLTDFKIDTLKIDMSVVREIVTKRNSRAVVGSIISLAQNLDLKVIAEGVESYEQFSLLKELGCSEIQGYYISKPLPAEDIKSMLMGRLAKEA